jgi:hypothetical protein
VIFWIAVSPWLWGFADSGPAVANHVSIVLGIGPLALMLVALRPAAFITIAAGVWLGLSPWILGYATNNLAWVNELVTGLLLVALSASVAGIQSPNRGPRRRATAGATAKLDAPDPPPVGH